MQTTSSPPSRRDFLQSIACAFAVTGLACHIPKIAAANKQIPPGTYIVTTDFAYKQDRTIMVSYMFENGTVIAHKIEPMDFYRAN